jgi:prophage tail gpP-like protein
MTTTTIAEFARLQSVSRKTVYDWKAKGYLTFAGDAVDVARSNAKLAAAGLSRLKPGNLRRQVARQVRQRDASVATPAEVMRRHALQFPTVLAMATFADCVGDLALDLLAHLPAETVRALRSKPEPLRRGRNDPCGLAAAPTHEENPMSQSPIQLPATATTAAPAKETATPPAPRTAATASKRRGGSDGDVTLLVDGREFAGWQEIKIGRGIERMPNDFNLQVTERLPGRPQVVVEPGQPCVVKIGGDTVITGFVDRYSPSISKQGGTTVRVTGRGKCQDLVDCSAYLRGVNNQIINARSVGVIRALADLFGITVDARGGDGDVVPQFNVILTETCWNIIDRVARHSNFLAYEGTDGQLIVSRAAEGSMSSGVTQGLNVERASVNFAYDRRYSLYEVVVMPTENLADVGRASGGNTFNVRARATDDTIGADAPGQGRRFRPLILMAEVMQNGIDIAQRRADWEKARRYGRSQMLEVEVDSWRDSAGKLWEPNFKAPLDLPGLKLTGKEWLIAEVTYMRGKDGTRAHLTLMPEEAFQPEPVILQPFDRQVQDELNRFRGNPRLGEGPGQ